MGRKVCKHRGNAGTVESEVLEQRRENGESLVLAYAVERFEEHHHALGGASVQRFDKLVGVESDFLAISPGFLYRFIMVRCKAVADISTF